MVSTQNKSKVKKSNFKEMLNLRGDTKYNHNSQFMKATKIAIVSLRLQSRTSNHKAWDCYPSSVGGKILGIILEVFVHEVFGNVARILLVSFPKSLVRISSHFQPKYK